MDFLSLRSAFLLPVILFTGLLAGCDQNPFAKGGSVGETTNGIYAGVLVDPQGEPVSSAQVTLFSPGSLTPQETIQTDSAGKFTLKSDLSKAHLQAQSLDSSLMTWLWDFNLQIDSSHGDSIQTLELLPSASLNGLILESSPDSQTQVCLTGTSYCSSLSEGAFHFSHIPAGAWSIELRNAQSSVLGSVELDASSTANQSFTPSSTGLLLDDFNDGNRAHLHRDLAGQTYWYLVTHGDFAFRDLENLDEISALMTTDSAYEGKSLSLHFSTNGDSAQVGTNLRSENQAVDLTDLVALRIRMKGDALVQIALEEGLESNDYRKTQFETSVHSEWHEFVFTPSQAQIIPEYPQAVPWDSIASSIRLFTIFIKRGTSLSIDQIRFEGIHRDVFYP